MQDFAVPESVSEAILERVSRLRPETRQALEEASVLGQVFGFDDLMAVVGLGEDDVEEAMEEAEASGLLWAAKVRYAFDHALTQQTLYAGLSAHLTSLDRPGASEGSRRAMAALYCALARLYIARRRFAEGLDAAKRAASLSREVEAIGLLADAEMVRGIALLWLDAPDEGVKTLEEAVVLAEDSGALDALGTALLLLHLVYMVRGEFDRSREHAERGAAIAKKTGDTDLLSMHTANLGLLHFYLGDWQEAQRYLELAVKLERSTQLSFFSGQPHTYLGMLYKARGAWEDASRCFSEAVALARSMPYPYAEARLSCEYGMLHLREKEPARARK
jgi:tetratricopeptide (TPR) repeat protein